METLKKPEACGAASRLQTGPAEAAFDPGPKYQIITRIINSALG